MTLPRIQPILPIRSRTVPVGPEWVYELKLDGFRGVLHVERGRGYFTSKTGRRMQRFQELADGLARDLPARSAILDGEIIVMGEKGPDFAALFYRRGDARYVSFDLLWLDGRDLRSLPMKERKERLRPLVERSPVGYSPETGDSGLFRSAAASDLEGIVAKRWADPYAPDTEWLKGKHRGYSQARGRSEFFIRSARR